MNVKIDTKEKFVVISPSDPYLTANMTEELKNTLFGYMQKDIPHVILNLSAVEEADDIICDMIAAVQQKFYEQGFSFVICELQKKLEEKLDRLNILELLNVTPTESEAWDIVQMEEIERELLGGEEPV